MMDNDIKSARDELDRLEKTATTIDPMFWFSIEMAREALDRREALESMDVEKTSIIRSIFSWGITKWRALRKSI